MDSTIDVCIPWRPQPDRLAAFQRVEAWWRATGFNIVTGDSGHEPFNLAATRNLVVGKATSDVVVVADADTIPDLAALRDALANPDGVVYPFTRYRYLPAGHEADADLMAIKPDKEFTSSVGGLLVCRRETWDLLGGQDEGFRQWGYEDNAFLLAAQTLSTVRRVQGTVFAFGHTADRDMTAQNPGRSRIELYKFANGRRDVMRELVRR
ncbi:galactosyltransferase-related protein [Nocardia sp. NPDC004260]